MLDAAWPWSAAALAAVGVLLLTRGRISRGLTATLALAAFALVGAASDARIGSATAARVAVLVDLSPSTRGMWFRDRSQLLETVSRLLPADAQWKVHAFADATLRPLPEDAKLPDVAVARTRLPPIDADAVLLLSDGQVDPRANPHAPIYPLVDLSDRHSDAQVVSAEFDRTRLTVTIANSGPPRTLSWPDGSTTRIDAGISALTRPAPTTPTTLRIDPGDRWPENDALSVRPQPNVGERWWIGSDGVAGYRSMNPGALPPVEEMLNASVIVLNDIHATAIASERRRDLVRYVRDLGGALVIGGGEQAFGAGGYGGTELDTLSPLSSLPPDPRRDWLVLVDASGSMATTLADGRTKLDAAIDAARAAAATIPAGERVVAGTFARDVRWWPADVRHAAPPSDLRAGGPTNLRHALEAVAARPGDLPQRLVLVTDGRADLGEVGPLAASLAARTTVVDWLAVPPAEPEGSLARLVSMTGGSVLRAGDVREWTARAREAVAAAVAVPAVRRPITIEPRGTLAGFGTIDASVANEVYPRESIVALGTATVVGRPHTLIASWRVGAGRVVAAAIESPPALLDRLARDVERPARDPRFTVNWLDDSVVVEAAADGAALNDLALELRRADDAAAWTRSAFEQVGPGRYVAAIERRPAASILTIVAEDRPLDTIARPGRPDAEFDQIGLDGRTLETLARTTGGRVIDVRRSAPLRDLPRPRRPRPLTLPLTIIGLTSLAVALGLARRPT